jgi:beta-glucosidase
MGKGRLYINGKQVVDLWTSHPKKTLQTPMFNQASMELTADLDTEVGKTYEISVLLRNESMTTNIGTPYVGTPCIGGVRIGCCEKIDPAAAIDEAVQLARNVDVPIVIAGLNADYESEAVDRQDLELPPGINELIWRVARANPKTVS